MSQQDTDKNDVLSVVNEVLETPQKKGISLREHLNKIVVDTPIEDSKYQGVKYDRMNQGCWLTYLCKIDAKKPKVDENNGSAIFEFKDVAGHLTIAEFIKREFSYRASAILLFLTLIKEATNVIMTKKDNLSKVAIIINSKEYQQKRGLGDRKKMIAQMKEDWELIRLMSFNVKKLKEGGKVWNDVSFSFFTGGGANHHGDILAYLTPQFAEILKECAGMQVPLDGLLKCDIQKYPSSVPMAIRLCQHLRMNYGKPNEHIIKIGTLMDNSMYLTNIEKVRKSGDRHLDRRIIDPFQNTLNEGLGHLLVYDIVDKDGKAVESDDRSKANINQYREYYIKFSLNDYPDQGKFRKARKPRKKKLQGTVTEASHSTKDAPQLDK